MPGRFVLKSSRGGKFRFNLCAGNGQVILTSDAYSTKTAALDGIAAVAANHKDEKLIDRRIAKNGKPYFNLKSTSGQVVGKSQLYTSNAAMEKGIRSVINNGGARVDDQARSGRPDLTGVPSDEVGDDERVRSMRVATDDLSDPIVGARVAASLERLNSASSPTITKSEFLAMTEHSVA